MPSEDLWGITECVVDTNSPFMVPPKHQHAALCYRHWGNQCIRCRCAGDQSSCDHSWVTVIASLSRTSMLCISLVCEGAHKVFTHSDAVKRGGRARINKQEGDTWWQMATFPLASTSRVPLIHTWTCAWSSWQHKHTDVTYIKEEPWTTSGVNNFQKATKKFHFVRWSRSPAQWLSRVIDWNCQTGAEMDSWHVVLF